MIDPNAIIEIIKRRLAEHKPGAKLGDQICWAVYIELEEILKEIQDDLKYPLPDHPVPLGKFPLTQTGIAAKME